MKRLWLTLILLALAAVMPAAALAYPLPAKWSRE